jgi:hypothetical protein
VETYGSTQDDVIKMNSGKLYWRTLVYEADPRDVETYGRTQDDVIKMNGGELHTPIDKCIGSRDGCTE